MGQGMTMTHGSTMDGPGTHAATRAIGARLRDMFDSVASGPMPEHLLALVDQLETAYRNDCLTPAPATGPIRR
jgi:hypothetical protein